MPGTNTNTTNTNTDTDTAVAASSTSTSASSMAISLPSSSTHVSTSLQMSAVVHGSVYDAKSKKIPAMTTFTLSPSESGVGTGIRGVLLDDTCCVCPVGDTIVYLTTTVQNHDIHDNEWNNVKNQQWTHVHENHCTMKTVTSDTRPGACLDACPDACTCSMAWKVLAPVMACLLGQEEDKEGDAGDADDGGVGVATAEDVDATKHAATEPETATAAAAPDTISETLSSSTSTPAPASAAAAAPAPLETDVEAAPESEATAAASTAVTAASHATTDNEDAVVFPAAFIFREKWKIPGFWS
jgi:hypothetical protein